MAKTSIPREEKGGGRKRGRGAWEREGCCGLGARQKGRERERRGGESVFMVPTQGSKIPLDLN